MSPLLFYVLIMDICINVKSATVTVTSGILSAGIIAARAAIMGSVVSNVIVFACVLAVTCDSAMLYL